MWTSRQPIYRAIEKQRDTKVLSYITGDRRGLETQVSPEVIDLFVDLLDQIGPTKRISLILHTNGGNTAAAWRLVNLIKTFCDELEVLIPSKALSAGTLISLGASKIVMTKQAALGPIDPSLDHALNPQVVVGSQSGRVPVSVEAVRGYLDEAKNFLGSAGEAYLAQVYIDLANKIHPLVLGQIFRTRQQIRNLAKNLIDGQIQDQTKIEKIIDFLCSDSGSHDYTINRREALGYGLNIEKPTQKFYQMLRNIYQDFAQEMELLNPYDQYALIGQEQRVSYAFRRALVESTNGGCYAFVSEGMLTAGQMQDQFGVPQQTVTDNRTFEGWRKVNG